MASASLPHDLKPMLAKAGPLPEDYSNYGFEIKWDGLRAIAYIEAGGISLASRNLKNITSQYPELAALGKTLGRHSVILDGEIVALDQAGQPSFSSLQHRMGLRSATTIAAMTATIPVHYMIFDILFLEGHSLQSLPYTERRAMLEALALNGSWWQTPPYRAGQGPDMVAASRDLGLEGVVAKRLTSLYEAGRRSGAWIKIKNQQRQELVIAGWVPGRGRRSGQIGAILTGYYDVTPEQAVARNHPQRLLFAGKVGTGFSDAMLHRLKAAFEDRRRTECPFSQQPPDKNALFIEPDLVGEFEFTEWTQDHTLRHPSFKGLRHDKEATSVIRE
ncbi:MAG: non-homologous end-joining DNA ligase [Negativicutes bacterium]|nr:non-homologous end-joining DNA ligase [Negativicutes bacterium]